ncbi:MAG TPA: DNA mismatch repair endonuclease MutL [Anaeromyxobacteraceae bacterium]|nr:DNA mismatch repair endonuclease MutL [Anaeromyxobacteraceae bacterium]
MANVRVLPPDLVNQIAAGEVVERPGSVVKELVENALDAGARAIQVDVEDGGLSLVRVADDGSGMAREDALLALERHATSKLRDAAGLHSIATMGFRGEALPAIASVSRMRIDTSPAGDGLEPGTRVVLEGGRVVEVGEVARARGTTVEVRDLFFNTPARRKFMRSGPAEASHVSEAILRVALARTDVAFTLRSGGRVTLSTPAGAALADRAAAALGRDVHRHLIALDARQGDIRVRGVVASPDHSGATSRGLYLFVNGRYVRDRGAAFAVLRAYAGSLPAGRHPAGVLFLDTPLEAVDVNVHPQKLEVRFSDARTAYDAIYRAVSEALRPAPWLRHASAEPRAAPVAAEEAAEVLDAAARGAPALGDDLRLPFPPPRATAPGAAFAAPEAPAGPPGYFGSLRFVGQHARTYLLCEAPGGTLVVIDQHASHERLLFHGLRKAFRERELCGQPYLVPPVVPLPAALARGLEASLADVRRLGLEVEPFGRDSFAVKAAPALLAGVPMQPLLSDLAEQLEQAARGEAVEEAIDGLLATMACHAAVRANQGLSREEAQALLDGLDAIDFKARCPHGRPVVVELPLAELEKRVGRR